MKSQHYAPIFASTLLLLPVVAAAACRTLGVTNNTGGASNVSSFTLGNFTPGANGPAWTSVSVDMEPLSGGGKAVKQTFAVSAFSSGPTSLPKLLVSYGSYSISLSYQDAKGTLLYQECAGAMPPFAYSINQPKFTVTIPVCPVGNSQNPTGNPVAIGPTATVTINPVAQGAAAGTGTPIQTGTGTPIQTGTGTPIQTGTGGSNGTASSGVGGNQTSATQFNGMATHFDHLGTPYGGCGVPEAQVDSPNFVALNVQNTPQDYSTYLARPIPESSAAEIGTWNNGLNCGRWVQVTIGDACNGANGGGAGSPACPSWVADTMNGATLNMVVADSCADSNQWCRDNQYHLDLSTSSLANFTINNQPVGAALAQGWSNRQITWKFIPAPNYLGDLKIGFGPNASQYYLPIIITNLPNGIHGVDIQIGGSWQAASMQSDNGQLYLLPTTATSPYSIRVYDATDQLVGGGRVYQFGFPGVAASYVPTIIPQ